METSIKFVVVSCGLLFSIIMIAWIMRLRHGEGKPVNLDGIIFLKTHKTASSTVTGILWRHYCEPYDKSNCFLPPAATPGKTWDLRKHSDWDTVTNGNRRIYNVWLHHLVFDKRIFQVVPTATRIISICRNPLTRFQSAWNWYGHSKTTNMTLHQFIENKHKLSIPKFRYRTGLDATSEELLGLAKDSPDFSIQFKVLLSDIDKGKLVLLVCDRFDESMLVLKHLLKWDSIESILYLKQKVFVGPSEVISAHIAKSITDLQPYDMALYNKANDALNRLIVLYGSSFQSDLREYQSLLAQLQRVCDPVPVSGPVSDSRMTMTMTMTMLSSSGSSPPSFQRRRKLLNPIQLHANESQLLALSSSSSSTSSVVITTEPELKVKLSGMCAALLRDNKDNVRRAWQQLTSSQV